MNLTKKHARHLAKATRKEALGTRMLQGIAYSIEGEESNPHRPIPTSLLAPNHDAENTATLTASDGRVLVILPVKPHEGDVPAILSTESLADACRRPSANGGVARVTTEPRLSGTASPSVTVENDGVKADRDALEGDYPRVGDVVQEGYEFGVTVDAAYLATVLQAVGGSNSGDKGQTVRLMFKPSKKGRGIDPKAPVRVESCGPLANCKGAIGLVMPVTVEGVKA